MVVFKSRTLVIVSIAILLLVITLITYMFFKESAPKPEETKKQSAEKNIPKFEKIAETYVDGANLWIFAINDGEDKLAVSAEKSNNILLGRLDINHPNQKVNWKTAVSKDEVGGPVADHWHIFAHGKHWIALSVSGGKESYLAAFDKDFNRVHLGPVSNALPNVKTNDMFSVEEEDGVSVGHFLLGTGHKIFRFNKDGSLKTTVDVGGGKYTHVNGSSAEKTKGGFVIFASDSLALDQEGGVRKIETKKDWEIIGQSKLISEQGTNISMVTSILLENGVRIVNAKVRTDLRSVDSGTLQSDKYKLQIGTGTLPNDSGSIVRYLISTEGKVLSKESLVSSGANRPHTSLIRNLLITTWDEAAGAKIRIDKIII